MSNMQAVHITESAVIRSIPGTLRGVGLAAGAGAPATVTIYDSADDSGNVIAIVEAIASYSSSITGLDVFSHTAIYAKLSGVGAECVVYIG